MIDIIGYEGLYSVTRNGEVFGKKRGKFLKISINTHGYAFVRLCSNGTAVSFTIHRIVANHFILNHENKPQVNHINGVKTDNRVENLEWCTASENHAHLHRVLGHKNHHFFTNNPSSIKNGTVGKKIGKFSKDLKLLNIYTRVIDAGDDNNIFASSISNCMNGRVKSAGGFIWKYL